MALPIVVAIFVVVQAKIIQRDKARDAAAKGLQIEDAEQKFAAAANIEANESVLAAGD